MRAIALRLTHLVHIILGPIPGSRTPIPRSILMYDIDKVSPQIGM